MQFESFALYQHTRLPKEQELLRSREKAKLDHRIDGDEEHLSLLSTLQSLGNLDDHNSGEERVEPEKDLDEQMKEQIKLINEEIRQLQQEEEEIVEEERQAVSKQVKSADGVDIDELIDISLDLIAILDRALGNVGKIKRREEAEEPREEDIFKLTQHIDEGLETPSFQGLYREGLEDKQLFTESLEQIQVSSPKPRTETCYMLMENVGEGMGELTPLIEGAEEISEQEEEGTQEIDYKRLDKIQKEVHEAFVSIAEQAENAQKILDGILKDESSLGHDKECPLCNDRRR